MQEEGIAVSLAVKDNPYFWAVPYVQYWIEQGAKQGKLCEVFRNQVLKLYNQANPRTLFSLKQEKKPPPDLPPPNGIGLDVIKKISWKRHVARSY